MFRLFFRANRLYSILWIACTGKSKFEYRDESWAHHFLVWAAYMSSPRPKGIAKAP